MIKLKKHEVDNVSMPLSQQDKLGVFRVLRKSELSGVSMPLSQQDKLGVYPKREGGSVCS